ncbi:hypothetical protein JMM81_20780 [Bacillus sp. V3B]|uniref:hypothetical protein n=1 Tax=Bacillus sp. V3B TaxID=2804915 RepID=UPI00210D4D67|nr:hypothetical protein [Bacillus sp. V3B]MCQ6277312.1 hypothetical protein [Bacillus sp. V3B]
MYENIYRERNQTLKLAKEMSANQFSMLLVIAVFVEEHGLNNIHASKEEIARCAGLSASYVPKVIKALLDFRTSEGEAVIERIGVDRYRMLKASGIVLEIPKGAKIIGSI